MGKAFVMALTAGPRFDFSRPLAVVVDAVPTGAGSVVMGTGIVSIAMDLAHRRALSDALGVLAVACFAGLALVLAVRVIRDRSRALAEARSPAGLTGVATGARWLADLALAPAAVGIAIYPDVLVRFDPRGLRSGRGEHWVAGGSLAISAVACAQIMVAERRLGNMPVGWGSLEWIALGLWVGAMLWLPVLVIAEARWPRLSYDRHRWSTVFPLGMYSVCSFSVSVAAHRPWIADFARDWAWLALAAWTATMLGTLRRCLDATYSAGR